MFYSAERAVGFQNSATGIDLGFYAACPYSLMSPIDGVFDPRTCDVLDVLRGLISTSAPCGTFTATDASRRGLIRTAGGPWLPRRCALHCADPARQAHRVASGQR